MVAISFLPSIKNDVKIVRLSRSLQLTPFSIASFEHVWLRIAFGMQSLFWMMVTGIANSPYF
jgi:hypothetical protein